MRSSTSQYLATSNSHSCLTTCAQNLLPWSDRILSGMAVLEKIVHNPSATALAVTVRKGTASGHLVARQMYVSKYLLPPLPFGKGPTRSIATDSKGSVSTGLSTAGAFLGSVLALKLTETTTTTVFCQLFVHPRPNKVPAHHRCHLLTSQVPVPLVSAP